jgi:hypothetical protein
MTPQGQVTLNTVLQKQVGLPVSTGVAVLDTDITELPITHPRIIPPGLTYAEGTEGRVREVNPPSPLVRYRDAVTDAEKMPLEKVSRGKAALLAILRNLGQMGPLQPGENFWAKLLGTAMGSGAVGLINPKIEAKYRHDQQVGKAQKDYQKYLGGMKVESDIADAEVDRDHKRAMAEKARRVPASKITYKQNAQGQVLRIKENPDGEPEVSIVDRAKKTIAPNVREIDGRLKIFNPETRQFDDALDSNGRPITSELKTPVNFTIGGVTYKVTPSTAAMATATGQRFEISQANTNADQSYKDNREAEDRRAKNEEYKAQADSLDAEADNLEFRAKGNLSIDPQESERMRREAEQKRREARAARRQILPDITPRSTSPSPRPSSTRRTYTKDEVQRYADAHFKGDYNKAKEKVLNDGFGITQ